MSLKTKTRKAVRELKSLRTSSQPKAADKLGRCCRCCRCW